MAGVDILEEILSYLPVKSLLRFKSVSKFWYATISDASFAGIHLRRQRKNNHQFLTRLIVNGNHQTELIEFNKDWQVQESLLLHDGRPEIPNELTYTAVCYGDGLTIGCDIRCLYSNPKDNEFVYAVWNPSTRSLQKFQCPYNSMMMGNRSSTNHHRLFGLGYDSLTNEYKFVICNGVQYAIYYCRNKCWSEVKNVEEFTFKIPLTPLYIYYSNDDGFFSKSSGDFYWCFRNQWRTGSSCTQLVCFDAKEEKIKRLPDPPCAEPKAAHPGSFIRFVASMEDNLVFYNCEKKILALKSGDGGEYSWTTLIDGLPKLPRGYIGMIPLYLAMKDGIVIFHARTKRKSNDESNRNRLLVYKVGEQIITFFESRIPYSYQAEVLIPYAENVFFSRSENGGQVI